MKTLPMGCQQCGVVRRDHDAPDHRWQAPSMHTAKKRAAAWRKREAA